MRNESSEAPRDAAARLPQAARGRPLSFAYLVWSLFAGHTMASMAMLVLPAVAPEIAREYGIDASLIGYQISLVSTGHVLSLLHFGNFSRRFGAARTNQFGHSMVALGMLLMALPSPLFLVLGSLGVGTGYGMLGPSATALLMRFTPAERRNFVFSLQQTGIPIGGILAALIAPALAVTVGWRWALLLTALLLLAVVAIVQHGRERWDDDRDAAVAAVSANPLANVAVIWRDARLRLLAVAGGFFCWGQFCVASYTVVASVETFGMSLIVAGTVLTVVQLSNTVSRMAAGWIADRVGGTRVLLWLAGLMLAACVASFWMAPAWPAALVYVLFALHGIATGAWAGIMLAEMGRLVAPGQVGTAMSGALVYINAGKLVGPAAFAGIYAFTTNYGLAFALVGLPALLALHCLSRAMRAK
jgi:MFS family permease